MLEHSSVVPLALGGWRVKLTHYPQPDKPLRPPAQPLESSSYKSYHDPLGTPCATPVLSLPTVDSQHSGWAREGRLRSLGPRGTSQVARYWTVPAIYARQVGACVGLHNDCGMPEERFTEDGVEQ